MAPPLKSRPRLLRRLKVGLFMFIALYLILILSVSEIIMDRAILDELKVNRFLVETNLPRSLKAISQALSARGGQIQGEVRALREMALRRPKHREIKATTDADGSVFTVNTSRVLDDLCSRLTGPRRQAMLQEVRNITSRPVVNPHNFDYTHNEPEACKRGDARVMLLIAVPVRQESFHRRQTIRDTWGQYASDPAYKTVLLFFLGSGPNATLQKQVNTEAKRHRDIVQETFLDTYRNLSLKSVAVMRWASVYCPDSTFLLKADDDVYVNVPRLLRNVQHLYDSGKQLFIAGFLCRISPVRRSKKDKWYVSRKEYEEDWYPRYVGGPSYVMTTVTAMRLYVESLYTKLFPMEDVYLTGLCAQQASIERLGDADFPLTWNASLLAAPCTLRKHAADHKLSPEVIRQIYKTNRRLEQDKLCDGSFMYYYHYVFRHLKNHYPWYYYR